MDLNRVRQVIRDESLQRLVVARVISVDGADHRTVSVRTSGGSVMRGVSNAAGGLHPGMDVLVASLSGTQRPFVIGAVESDGSTAASGASADRVLTPPSGLVAHGEPLFIFVQWTTHPGHTDIAYEVQSSPAEDEVQASTAIITHGSYYLYAALADEKRYFRVRSIRWRSESEIYFSGWSLWVNATALNVTGGTVVSSDPDFGNLITVAKSGGDFATLGEAMASIVTQGWTRSVIRIFPGVYPAEDVTIKTGVSIVGVAGGLLAGSSVSLGGKLIIDQSTAVLGIDLANLTIAKGIEFINLAEGWVRVSKCLLAGSGNLGPIDMTNAKSVGDGMKLLLYDTMISVPATYTAKLKGDVRFHNCLFYGDTDAGSVQELSGAQRVEFHGCVTRSATLTITLDSGCVTVFDGSIILGSIGGTGTWQGQYLDGSGNLYQNGNFTAKTGKWEWQARTPATLSANQNDYDPGNTLFLRLVSSVNVNITGLANGSNGRVLSIHNAGNFKITLKHQDAASQTANWMALPDGLDLPLLPNATALLQYDATALIWRLLGTSVGVPTTSEVMFTVEGTLSTGAGTIRFYNKLGRILTIKRVYIAVDTAPSGQAIIVDVNKNGTSIFVPSDRPQIAAGFNTGESTTIAVPSWPDGDYLTVDRDQVGSPTPGANLTVHIVVS